ncbi:MAG: alanine--glyoxylate aminotransferase family protein, partial [Anaerolineae bacterium]|nr:alanine--glyoxylate aminotransferase family protein [Anaerolineae bacterium]
MTHVTLFIPGPSEVREDILHAQTAPMIGHRSDECNALIGRVESKLQQVFMTNSRVYILASSGSGLQEAAIRNGVRDGRTVVNFVNGAFAQRWHNVSLGCGKQAVRVDIPWGAPVTPEAVDAALAALDGSCDAITVVQNETSTGVRSPVGKIAALVHDKYPDTLVLVDAVSSLSGDWIPVDEWELDVCLTSSQKALALPPGLAFAAVSDRTLARASEVVGRGWYFDFLLLEKYLVKNTTPATPAISLLRAADRQLDHILAEGLEARVARHRRLAEITQAWSLEHGFDLLAAGDYRSLTVTCVENTRGIDFTG